MYMKVIPFEHALPSQHDMEALGTKELVPQHYRCAVVTSCGIIACFRHERDAYEYVEVMRVEGKDAKCVV